MNVKKLFVLIACLSALSACATKIHTSKPEEVKQNGINNTVKLAKARQEHIADLLSFSDSYSNLTVESQKTIFAETNQTLVENKYDVTQRIKLAIMLSIPSSRLRDVAKAQALLQNLLQENSLNPAESALVSLLYEYILDTAKQTQKNRDDVKKLEAAQVKYENLQQKYDELEQKLNDLKNIEKTMNDRDTKPASKP